MDHSTKRRLFLGFLSNWIGRLLSTAVQLVQVPVFLHFWSVPLYGEWMIINSIPSYLTFSNLGFGTVAGNEMTMLVARGERAAALRIFQSCWWLITFICGAVIVMLSGVLYFIPANHMLKLSSMSESDTKWIIFYLGISVLLAQLEQLLQSAYRSVGRYPYGSFLKNIFSLFAYSGMIASVPLGAGPRIAALIYAATNIAGTLFLCIMVQRDIPWVEYGWKHASFGEIRRLTRPAIAYMGFPVGNALSLQGTLLAVGWALGPTAVVVFGTARTVSRIALQMTSMVNGTFEPEMSLAYGAGNLPLLRSLLRRASQLALVVSTTLVIVTLSLGPWFLHHWTGGHVPPSRPLLTLLMLAVVSYSFWSSCSTVLSSTNQHQRLAAYYIVGTGLSCVLCYLVAPIYGLYGAASSTLVSEIFMNFYVVPACLRVTHDTFPNFFLGLLHYPDSLRPQILLERIRRSRPALEES